MTKDKTFPLGNVVATPNALDRIADAGIDSSALLARHMTGDWGDLDGEDKAQNDRALTDGGRLFSAYVVKGITIWIITEADRSVTTILLPED